MVVSQEAKIPELAEVQERKPTLPMPVEILKEPH
jgi:hypothetical protein